SGKAAQPEFTPSMGPRRWGRGKVCSRSPSSSRMNAFNGATTLGSWKSSERATNHEPRQRPFNGATTLGSWKSIALAAESTGRIGLQRGHDAGVVEKATWWPRRSSRATPFNGATTLGSWKRPILRLVPSYPWYLQWGHDAGVVEKKTAWR